MGGEDHRGMPQTLKAGSPQGIYSQITSQRVSRGCPLFMVSKQPQSSWLFAGHPSTPPCGRAGRLSVCSSSPKASLMRAHPLQPLPTLCFLLALFQAHFFSSPTWESSCCPEPTATILYKVIFPLSAENDTKVTPTLPKVSKETKHFSRSVPI